MHTEYCDAKKSPGSDCTCWVELPSSAIGKSGETMTMLNTTANYFPGEGGTKHDSGKLRYDLLPRSLAEVVAVYTYGANKPGYGPWNWRKGLAYSRLYAALLRHLAAWWFRGERNDREHGHHHLASVVFCALNLMEFEMDGIGNDDRQYTSATGTNRTQP